MLDIFPYQREVTNMKEKEAASKKEESAKKPAAGGFPFTIGEKADGPVPTPSSIGGFPFSISSPNGLMTGTTTSPSSVASSLTENFASLPKKPETSVTFKLPSESTV